MVKINKLYSLGLGVILPFLTPQKAACDNTEVLERFIEAEATSRLIKQEEKKDATDYKKDPEGWHKNKLEKLLSLNREDTDAIQDYLSNLKTFYYFCLELDIPRRERLLQTAKPYLTKFFQTLVEDLSSGNPNKQRIGTINLKALRDLTPSQYGFITPELIDVQENTKEFFDKALANNINNDVEALIDSSFVLLDLLEKNNDYSQKSQKFTSWIKEEMDKSIQSKTARKCLTSATQRLIFERSSYITNTTASYRAELFLKLISSYINLIKMHSEDSNLLIDSFDTYALCSDFANNELQRENHELYKKFIKAIQPLIEQALEGMAKQKDRTFLLKSAFMIIGKINANRTDELDFIASVFNKKYFSECHELKDLLEVSHLVEIDPLNKIPRTYTPFRVLVQVVYNNLPHFDSYTKKLIQDLANGGNKGEKTLSDLRDLYLFYLAIPNINSLGIPFEELEDNYTARLKLMESTAELREKITEGLLVKLKNENAELKLNQKNGEISLSCNSWLELNKILGEIILYEPNLALQVLDIVEDRLKKDKPHLREIDYEILGYIFLINPKESDCIDLIKKRLSIEENSMSMRGLGEALVQGMSYEKKREQNYWRTVEATIYTGGGKYLSYLDFTWELKEINKGEDNLNTLIILGDPKSRLIQVFILDNVIPLLSNPAKPVYRIPKSPMLDGTRNVYAPILKEPKILTPIQHLTVDAIRVLDWDTELLRNYLPEWDSKKNSELSLDDFKKLDLLRTNAFLMLANMISHLPDYALRDANVGLSNVKFANFGFSNNETTSIFKKEITTILERDFEHNLTYTSLENLAKRVAALYEVYLVTDDIDVERNIFIEQKEKYLKQILMSGEDAIFKRYTGDVAKARLTFAETVLLSAPYGDMEKYKKFLGNLNFEDKEINTAQERVMKELLK